MQLGKDIERFRELVGGLIDSGKVRQDDVAARLTAIANRPIAQTTVSRWLQNAEPRHQHTRYAVAELVRDVESGRWPIAGAKEEPQAAYGWGFDWQRVLDILDRESRAAEDRAAAARGVVAAVRESFSPSARDVADARIAQEAQAIADRAERSRPNALRPPSTEDRSASGKERDASDPDNN
jgi:hypothetical protein